MGPKMYEGGRMPNTEIIYYWTVLHDTRRGVTGGLSVVQVKLFSWLLDHSLPTFRIMCLALSNVLLNLDGLPLVGWGRVQIYFPISISGSFWLIRTSPLYMIYNLTSNIHISLIEWEKWENRIIFNFLLFYVFFSHWALSSCSWSR